MDVGQGDTVIMGAQLQGPPAEGCDLVFRHRRQEQLTALRLPEDTARRLEGYVSSVAVDVSGEIAAVTSSHGAVAAMVEIATGRLLRTVSFDDVSGITATPQPRDFLLTSGSGCIAAASPAAGMADEPASTPWQWDNHATMLPAG
jgi:hypothetical protein